MKRKEVVEVTACENCEKVNEYCSHCHGCQKDYCHDCRKRFLKDFPNAVHFSGSDLTVCTECLANPPKVIVQALKAYRLIEALRAEQQAFYENFRPRMEAAEKETKKHYDIIRGW